MMKSMQIVERSRRLLYLYTANVIESRRAIFFLTLVYEELLETSLSLHFSTIDMFSVKNLYIEKTSDAILIIINKLIKHAIYILMIKDLNVEKLVNLL